MLYTCTLNISEGKTIIGVEFYNNVGAYFTSLNMFGRYCCLNISFSNFFIP